MPNPIFQKLDPKGHNVQIKKVISGGQTGVDQGALYGALDAGLSIGGFAPKGYRTEDGKIPEDLAKFMTETEAEGYEKRTHANVLKADATLVLHVGKLGIGSQKTVKLAIQEERPLIVIDLEHETAFVANKTTKWRLVDAFNNTTGVGRKPMDTTFPFVRTLNVAGPRESHAPGLQERVRVFVKALLTPGTP